MIKLVGLSISGMPAEHGPIVAPVSTLHMVARRTKQGQDVPGPPLGPR